MHDSMLPRNDYVSPENPDEVQPDSTDFDHILLTDLFEKVPKLVVLTAIFFANVPINPNVGGGINHY